MEYLNAALKLSGVCLVALAAIMVALLLTALCHTTRYGVDKLNGKVRSNNPGKEKR